MPKYLIVLCTILVTTPIAMMAGIWQINKYEILLEGAYYTHHNLIPKRKKQAAKRWEQYCAQRISKLIQ